MNITKYVKTQAEVDFATRAFCDIDALILCQLSYLIYDSCLLDTQTKLPLNYFSQQNIIDEVTNGAVLGKATGTLLAAMGKSQRFKDMQIFGYTSDTNNKKEKQFCAVAFELSDIVFVAFRGTDYTILGWKEDFNMAYLDEIPSQKAAVRYLNRLEHSFKDKRLYVGGHSKGGNIALYAATFCKAEVQDKIEHVYNFDGPGFKKHLFKQEEFKKIEPRVHKYIPHDSMVGIMLNHSSNSLVVSSRGIGILQHMPFNWRVKGVEFVYVKNTSRSSRALDKAIFKVLESMDDEARLEFVDALFGIFEAAGITKVSDFAHHSISKIKDIINAIKNYDDEKRALLKETAQQLVGLYFKNSFSKND